MQPSPRPLISALRALVMLGLCMASVPALAVPLAPAADHEVVEVLPAASGNREEEKRARRQLKANPRDPALAVAVAKRYLQQAHELGDPRFAGLAVAAIQPWRDPADTPDAVLLVKADLQQYLHEFDAAAQTLNVLLERKSGAGQAQPWLTLATVRRVQGRYAESDAACKRVAVAGAALHAEACIAENAALRGEVVAARQALTSWIGRPGVDAGTRTWLWTTLAELEQRDGRPAAAEKAFQQALRAGRDDYALLAYVDLLIEQGRPGEALQRLQGAPRSDAVVLRLAIAGAQAKGPNAAADARDMRERIALANERPEARTFHGREQAMFALHVERSPALALELARINVEQQREPLDVLVLAQAAHASGDAAALEEARRLRARMGLHDRRLDGLL